MSEDALTFADLQTHIAVMLGVAYYGAAGDEAAQPPTDTPTLTTIKGYVNGGIRMLIGDAPAEGWRCLEPVASVSLWPTTTTGAVTVGGVGNKTLTVAADTFYPEMVGHTIVADTSSKSYTIAGYTSAKVITVTADASADTGDTFTITADGNYTLPADFGGEYKGTITFEASSNSGEVQWASEGEVRRLRENIDSETGAPSMAAVRKMSLARRWELVVYPIPDSLYIVQFPYELYFTAFSADGDLHPFGSHYDEAVKAACEAYAELHGEDTLAGRALYYEQKALPAAKRVNTKSAPKRLGNLLTGRGQTQERNSNWRNLRERPAVTTP